MSASTSNAGKPVGVFGLVLGLLWLTLVLLIPFLGMWTASSLTAYRNGPVWLVCVAGALLFPILPLLWDAWAQAKRRKPAVDAPPALSWWDRVVLRTLFLNILFLAALLWRFPDTAFAALSTRGDWFLEGRSGPRVDGTRTMLFGTASRLEWLYRKVRQNRYEKELPEAKRGTTPAEPPKAASIPTSTVAAEPSTSSTSEESVYGRDGMPVWPMKETLHPLVAGLPAEVETDYASVARYLSERETNPWQRLKALHDYVADRIVYDAESYRTRSFPPQDAATVFRTRKAVCAGYARLLAAMGEAAGEDIRVVSGDARLSGSDVTGESHAWNVARVGISWVLVDATWDAGYLERGAFVKQYETSYLYAPPEVFAVSHFPDEPEWQLREPALTRGDFFRQPMMRARFFANGFSLLSPERSQVTVDDAVSVRVQNPRGRYLLGHLEAEGRGSAADCKVTPGGESSVDCRLPGPGTYRLRLFASPVEYSDHYQLVGELIVLGRGP